ncbi:MAG: hypothetical protein R3316_08465, partial [Rhodovibrionaceae bacterium]|nr:hypothetical protein [Rhodovibrionaceae bacterium]
DMRRRIEDQHKAKSIWKVKYLRGGLVDLEFLSQYWQLRHAHEHPQVLARNTQDAFHRLAEAGVIERDTAELLIDATRLMRRIQGLLRLTVGSDFDEDSASDGIKQTLARAGKPQKPEDEDVDFDTLKEILETTAKAVHRLFIETIEEPAAALDSSSEEQATAE